MGPAYRLPLTAYLSLMSDELPQTPPETTTVTWKPAGPYHILGPVVICDNEGTVLIPPPTKVPGMVKLCGCGMSKNRPFCDGSHKK